jgi:serine phosphatase RsbU (regulator of sigma subunit)
VVEGLETLQIEPGTLLMQEGERLAYLYLVEEGQVEIVKSLGTPDERSLGVRGAGTLLGEMGLFDPNSCHTASVRALSALRVQRMTPAQFEALVEQQPSLVYSLLRQISQRLTQSENATIADLRKKNQELTQAYQELQAAQSQLLEKERLEKEMQIAEQIQCSILPASLPQMDGYDCGALMQPARAVGGDFYDLIALPDGQLGMVLGDVSDKGVPAALIMSMTHTLVRVEASRDPSPCLVVENINRNLLRFGSARMFVTLLYGVLDCPDGVFHYVRAGHPPPFLCATQAEPISLDYSVGQLLGILDEPVYDEQEVSLPPGGALLIFSDGVTEAADPQGVPFGEAGLAKALAELGDLPAQELCEVLYRTILAYTAPLPQQDDITLLCIRRLA